MPARSARRSTTSSLARALALRSRSRWLHRNGPAALAVLALLVAVGCLELIGPPPAVRLDLLWVHERRALVYLLLYAVATSAGATLLTWLVRRGRAVVALAWIGAALLSVNWYAERLIIVARVVADRLVS